uniref:Uncharacterized protein n=1 Tax=Rhizophora mucronata TaxID=61149 RepID=A0A2P2QDH1_RHIMU
MARLTAGNKIRSHNYYMAWTVIKLFSVVALQYSREI